MVTWEQLDRLNLEEKKPDWFDRVTKSALVVVAVLGLTQEKTTWFPYVLFATLLLLSAPFITRQWKKWKLRNKQKQALANYAKDFMSFVNRAQDFVQSTNQYGIPNYLRNIVNRQGMEIKGYNWNVESFYSHVLRNLQARAKAGFKSYAEFEQVSQEFHYAMDSFVLIFSDDIVRELRQPKNRAAIQPHEISGLKQRYAALSGFVNEYNGFRAKLSVFWGQEGTGLQIRIPTETID